MRRLLENRFLVAIGLVAFTWIFTAGAAFAVMGFSKSLNASVNVLSIGSTTASPDFSFYSDSACTQGITSISLPDVTPGGTSTFKVYLKNTSSIAELISAGTNTVPASAGTLTLNFDGLSQKNLNPGSTCTINGILQSSSSAAAGPVNFAFTVNASPATSTDPAPALNGQQLFTTNCNSCHSGTVSTSKTQAQLSSFIPGHQTGRNLTSAEVSAIAIFIKP